ncbi:FAD-dependent oxidoreductase [Microbacterium sp.]|uniref:FAD-dependent oxidoreductase n=1 Tax=Microbacterium sp. TaxID=51671 RepID=UPI003F9CFB39
MASTPTTEFDVVIVGAGFAGVAAARRLGKDKIRTLLIDRNNYQQFQPLLYQVASSQLPVPSSTSSARPERMSSRTRCTRSRMPRASDRR